MVKISTEAELKNMIRFLDNQPLSQRLCIEPQQKKLRYVFSSELDEIR